MHTLQDTLHRAGLSSIRSHRATSKLRDFYECIAVVGCVYVFSFPFAQIKTHAKFFVFRDASRRSDTITDDEVGTAVLLIRLVNLKERTNGRKVDQSTV